MKKFDLRKINVREAVRTLYRRYLLDAMSAMGLGLFASLIIGLIISQISQIPYFEFLKPFGDIKTPAAGHLSFWNSGRYV